MVDPLEEAWAGTTPEPYRAGEWGPRAADEMLARDGRTGGGRDRRTGSREREHDRLWDTTGNEVVKALAAERRNAGGVTSGLALTLVVVVDEKRVREAEAAATIAAAAHPCRLVIVVRGDDEATATSRSRLDAEIVVGGRLGPCEAVVLRMHGRLALHAESVVMPLLAPDVPVVTWWHGEPPAADRVRPAGRRRRAPDHRLGAGHRPDGGAAAASRGLRARRHRPGLEPHHAVAHAGRRPHSTPSSRRSTSATVAAPPETRPRR